MGLLILGFFLLVLAIALGVWLGTGSLRPRPGPDYSEQYYMDRLQRIGVLTKEEFKVVSDQYNGRQAEQHALARMRKALLELRELDFLTETELEEKLNLLEQHYSIVKSRNIR